MLRRVSTRRLLPALLLLGTSTGFAADEPPVARVGKGTISAAALQRRLAGMPDFQRAALANTPDTLKRRVLENELVPELLYAEEADRRHLADEPSLKSRRRDLLREALERELRRTTLAQSPVTPDDIRVYFEANQSRFETPRRVRVWRILVSDEALARKIISDCQGRDGIQRWSDFAREQSLDKATHLRSGDLGFVHPDGNTDTPTVRVDASLFSAAEALKDGEISPVPIKEGDRYAVIWRRGSLKAVTRTLAQESGSIRQVLERQRLLAAREGLLAELQRKYVTARNDGALEGFMFDVGQAPIASPGPRPTHPAAASAAPPSPGERGER